MDVRKFLQPVAAQSKRVGHRDERVGAARRGERVVRFGHVDARNARAALHREQLNLFGARLADTHSRATQRASVLSFSVGLLALPRATRSVPLANGHLFRTNTRAVCPSRSCGTHCRRVGLCTRCSGRRRCRALASRAPLCFCHPRVTARRARVVTHSKDRVLISGCHKGLRREPL